MQHFLDMVYAGLLAKIIYTVTFPGILLIFAAHLITQFSWGRKKKRISEAVLRPNCIFIITCTNFPGLSSSYLQPLTACFPAERKHRALRYCIRGAFLSSANSHQLRSYPLICLLLPIPFKIYSIFFSGHDDSFSVKNSCFPDLATA